jgi:hypothetical protein
MFAMCLRLIAVIALAADGDICEPMFDGASDPNYQSKIDYGNSFAFKRFYFGA